MLAARGMQERSIAGKLPLRISLESVRGINESKKQWRKQHTSKRNFRITMFPYARHGSSSKVRLETYEPSLQFSATSE